MAGIPTGTVTFLFTDIQGSTKLAREHPGTWENARARHHAILHGAIEQYQGYVFQIIGDAFCAAFPTAADALKTSIKAQQELQMEDWGDTVIRVRMGIHTGEAQADGDGYRGYLTMSLVQRLMSAGHGSQILLSDATEKLLREELPNATELRDLGERKFKDVPYPIRIFQVCVPGLQSEFPPLHTADTHPNNLPTQLTSFVGREKELEDVKRLLQNAHMLTLIGPGGTGKTRLSIQAASEMLDIYPDGVWLVELAPVLDALLVPRTTAIAIGLREEPQRPVIDMLCDYLREKKMLVILDNCEHLVDTCAQMADRILHAAPHSRILASSREALSIGGEVTYRVPSLGLPDMNHLPPIETLDQYEAVKLFIDRASSAVPSFAVTNDNAPFLAQICHRLDGIPLAIELAAAKVRTLPLEQIAKRLDDRFRLLTGGSRTALERHQTLRAAIDWSYNVLPSAEQVLFRRLSVFVAGWTLEAAETVCADMSLGQADVLELLEHLINKSLVVLEDSRYRMLETIRQYANERLLESGESDALRDRHLEYFLNLAETAAPHLIRSEQLEWFQVLDADHENLRLALEWSLNKELAGSSLNFCIALYWFWEIRGHWLEGLSWVRRSLEKPFVAESKNDKRIRARALYTCALLEWDLSNYEQLLSLAQESLALASEISEKKDIAISRFCLGAALMFLRGDNDQAQSLLEQSVAEFQELNEPLWYASAFPYLGYLLVRQLKMKARDVASKYLELAQKSGDRYVLAAALSNYAFLLVTTDQTEEAKERAEESDRLYQQIGSTNTSVLPELLADIAYGTGNYEKARSLYLEMQQRFRVLGHKLNTAIASESLGLLAMEEGNLDEAQTYLEEALLLMQETGHKGFLSRCLVNVSNLFYLCGNLEEFKQNFSKSLSFRETLTQHDKVLILMSILGSLYHQKSEVAAQLLRTIKYFVEMDSFGISPLDKRYCIRAERQAREVLGNATFEAVLADRQKMTLDDALDLAWKTVEQM